MVGIIKIKRNKIMKMKIDFKMIHQIAVTLTFNCYTIWDSKWPWHE